MDENTARIAKLEFQFAVNKGFRTAADFALQLIQRAVVWATIKAAADITQQPILRVVEGVTFLFIFAWAAWSFQAAKSWLQARIKSQRIFNMTAWAVGLAELLLICLVLLAGSSFVTALAARLAGQ